MLLLALIFLSFLAKTNGITSDQAKCLIDCYAKCLNNGLLNATRCNCDPNIDQNFCSMNFDESIIQNSMINDVVPVKTEYLDSRRIRIQMDDNIINAFVYIFEYSAVNEAPDNWIFAGINTAPDITFAIEDACRDYQFRVIIILKSEEDRWLLVYRPRIIPVDLPTFAITPKKIQAEPPIYNADDDTVVVYISWENPSGYADSDIYGYESPAVYPVQCNSPEAELQSPSIELRKGGGRLRISLPSEVLNNKCRVWAEVQMLPRCIRLEPFNIQQSFELNCDKLTNLEMCKHEIPPQCTEIIDVWGYGNNATIMWSPQDDFGTPLYYNIRYGPAKMQGIPPLATWTIASFHELKVAANSTNLQLQVDPDIDYGIQVCGIHNEHRKKPKFELMRVIPFICTSCRVTPAESFGRCGECTKIEGPLLFERRCHPKSGTSCDLAGTSEWTSNDTAIKDQDILLGALTVQPSQIFIDSKPESTKINTPISENSKTSSISQQSAKSATKLGASLTTSEAQTTVQPKEKSFVNNDGIKQIILNTDSLNKVQTTSTASNSGSMSKLSTSVYQSRIITVPNNKKSQPSLSLCTLFNGVICEFGCINATKCNCPEGTSALMENGACLPQSNHRKPFVCFSTNDVTAIWNRWIHTIQIRSKKIYNEIKMHSNYDRIFLEFGHVKHTANGQFSFDEQYEMSNKVIIRTDKILRNGLFLTNPYFLYTNQTIDPLTYQYGLRICAFNNFAIKNPFAINWNQNTELTTSYVSAIQFERNFAEDVISNEQIQMTKMASIVVPIILIVLLVFLLAFIIYMNCARLKRCYDHRKIQRFRPFAWNASIPSMMNTVHKNKHATTITKSSF